MNKHGLMTLTLCLAGAAQAQSQSQDLPLSVSVGAKAWSTQWTTFSYAPTGGGSRVLTQVAAKDKVVLLPVLSVRYQDFVGSISGYQSTRHQLSDGSSNTRAEFDANVGYLVLPGVALTLGYKKVSQKGDFSYTPAGPVAGLSGAAPLGGAFSLYGAFGWGRMKTPSSTDPRIVQFDADYRLSEVGLAYNMAVGRLPKALAFTAGYRMQVLTSKDALGSQDGRDLTQGFTFGLVATF